MKLPYRLIGLVVFIFITLYLLYNQPTINIFSIRVWEKQRIEIPNKDSISDSYSGARSFRKHEFKFDFHKPTCHMPYSNYANVTYKTLSVMEKIDYNIEVINELDMSNKIPGIKLKSFKDPNNTLSVIVMPFSHNDPGWLKTLDAYYIDQTKPILDNMVRKLTQYKDMTFIWSEIVLLKRWWGDSNAEQRKQLKQLIKEGRIEIVMGGWVVPDEATTHYYTLLDQLIEGHQWLARTLGTKVNNSVSMDPFGYSATLPYILQRSGIKNTVILRIHEQTKNYLQQRRSLEFIWRQHWSKGPKDDAFCLVIPYMLYQISHQCGPQRSSCIFFDFRNVPGDFMEINPEPITPVNVEERSKMLSIQYRKKSQLFKHNVILVPLGDDFRYDHSIEWDQQYTNYKEIMKHINSNKKYNMKVKFGTINDYLIEVAKRIKQEGPDSLHVNPGDYFPTLSGDFYTYSDKDFDYWSGYFTTRPYDKLLDRQLQASLRAAEVLNTLALWRSLSTNQVYYPFTANLQRIEMARGHLALFQHHDSIPGTSKPDVVKDMEVKLLIGLAQSKQAMLTSAEFLFTGKTTRKFFFNNFKGVESGLTFNVDDVTKQFQHVNKLVVTKAGLRLIIYNPIAHPRKDFVRFMVASDSICVVDSRNKPVPSQINPHWRSDTDASDDQFELVFLAKLDAMGMQVFNIKHSTWMTEKAEHSKITLYGAKKDIKHKSGFTFKLGKTSARDKVFRLENQYMTAAFSKNNGMLKQVTINGQKPVKTNLTLAWYDPAASGAYLFRPRNPSPLPIFKKNDSAEDVFVVRVIEGPLTSEVQVIPKDKTIKIHLVRMCHIELLQCGNALEINNVVDLSGNAEEGKEIIMRLDTDVKNKLIFYTDSNSFQMIKRKTFYKIHIGGNYYPMTSMSYIEDQNERVSLLSAQSHGVASPLEGMLEVMLERRLLTDDNRGLGEGVYDNKPTGSKFILLFESRTPRKFLPSTPPVVSQPSLLAHTLVEYLTYPIYSFVTNVKLNFKLNSFNPIIAPLPCDVRVVNLRNLGHGRGRSQISTAMVLHRVGYECSFYTPSMACPLNDGTFKPSEVFKHWGKNSFLLTTLSMMHELKKFQAGAKLKLEPMELYTYLIEN